MKVNTKLKCLTLLTSASLLAGCFDGGSNGSGVQVKESQLAINVSDAPKGPASYAIYQNLHNDAQLVQQLNAAIKQYNTLQASKKYIKGADNAFEPIPEITVPGSCQTPGSDDLNSALGAVGLISGTVGDFVPEAAPVNTALGLASKLADIFDPGPSVDIATCMKDTLAKVNQRFSIVTNELNQLHDNMLQEDNFILGAIAANSNSELTLAYYDYINTVEKIIGDQATLGIYQEFLLATGVANSPTTDLFNIAKSSSRMMMAAFTLAITGFDIDQSFFNLAGATYNHNACASSPETCVNTIKPQSTFSQHTHSSLLLVLELAKNNLLEKINQIVQENANLDLGQQKNILDLYDQYNAFVVSLYHLSAQAITADYYLMRTSNDLNLYAAINSKFNNSSTVIYIPDFTGIPGTSYQPKLAASNSSADITAAAQNGVTEHKSAQRYLDTFYAGVINQLYHNVVSYMVTDFPVAGQLQGALATDWGGTSFTIKAGFGGYEQTNGEAYACYKATDRVVDGKQEWEITTDNFTQCLHGQDLAWSDHSYLVTWDNNSQWCRPSWNVSSTGEVEAGCHSWSAVNNNNNPKHYHFIMGDWYGTQALHDNWPTGTSPDGSPWPTDSTTIIHTTTAATIENAIPLSSIVASNGIIPLNSPMNAQNPTSGVPYLGDFKNIGNNAVLYQTSQLRDVNQCLENYIAYSAAGMSLHRYYQDFETTCPAFMPDIKGKLTGAPNFSDILSEYVISPVMVNDDGTTTQYGEMYGVIDACQSASEIFTYIPTTENTIAQKGTPYLTCRLWKSSDDFYKTADIAQAWGPGTPGTMMLNQSGNSWSDFTGITPTRPYTAIELLVGGGGYPGVDGNTTAKLPQSGDWFVTHISTDARATTAHTFWYTGGSYYDTLKQISTPDDVHPYPNYYWLWSGSLNHSSFHNNVALEMINIVVDIDGFYYPLTIQMFNYAGWPGKGYAVVQNPILNNVGFIIDGKKVPITYFEPIPEAAMAGMPTFQTPYQQLYPNYGWEVDYQWLSVPWFFTAEAHQQLVYKDVRPVVASNGGLPNDGQNGFDGNWNNPYITSPFAAINGVAFAFTGEQDGDQKQWKWGTMHIGYAPIWGKDFDFTADYSNWWQ